MALAMFAPMRAARSIVDVVALGSRRQFRCCGGVVGNVVVRSVLLLLFLLLWLLL